MCPAPYWTVTRGTVQYEAGHGHRGALLAPELALGTQGWRVPDATEAPSRQTGEWRDGAPLRFSALTVEQAGH